MKKYSVIVIVLLLIMILGGCKDSNLTHIDNKEPETAPEIQQEVIAEPEKNEDEELLNQIDVTHDEATVLNDKQIVTVWVENKSDKIFTGDVHITFRDGSKIIGSDMIIVEELKPGNKTYTKVGADLSNSIDMSYRFAREYSFADDDIGKDGTYDEASSEALMQYMFESFGGSGKKEFAASWYECISKLEIYKSEDVFYSIITVNTDDKTSIERIANTVLVNFKDVELLKTIVKNEDGDILFEKSK